MSFARTAFNGSVWFAAFQLATQGVSWFATILIARMLAPEDYGLVAMATLLTSCVEIVSELGIGAAVVQRPTVSDEELNGVFWLGIGSGVGFFGVGLLLAPVTAWLFGEPKILLLTQWVSVQFILGGLLVVPHSLLMRQVRFKEIGQMTLWSVSLGSLTSLGCAWQGWGAWALVVGYMVQRIIMVALSYAFSGWRPGRIWTWAAVRPFFHFGLNVTGSGIAYYLFQRADQFIVGRLFAAQLLGYYTMALQLSSLPTEKLVSLIRKTAFPVFAHYQTNSEKCRSMFLESSQYVLLVVAPLFIGGAVFGNELILVLLGEKWAPVVPLFRVLCLAQLFMALASLASMAQSALGRPRHVMIFHGVLATLMPISILLAAQAGFAFVTIPWVTLFPLVCIVWVGHTVRMLGIEVCTYAKQFLVPIQASAVTILGILGVQALLTATLPALNVLPLLVVLDVMLGALLYVGYLMCFDRALLIRLRALRQD